MNRRQKRILIRCLVCAALVPTLWVLTQKAGLSPLFFLIPYALIGYDVIIRALRNLFHDEWLDENFLMTVASIGALALGESVEGIMVLLLYQIGELFQSLAVGKSRKAIAELMSIRPESATVEREGELLQLPPDEVALGETIVIRPGDRVPLDGVVIEGSSDIDTSALSGESLPVDVSAGGSVLAGSINLNGLLRVRVTRPFGESTVSKILELISSSGENKAKAENYVTRFARIYTPAVVIGALLLAVLPPLILRGGWQEWIYRALTFLVISCPCALVISVPLSFFGGIGGASRNGILIKGSDRMEGLAGADRVVFDKTGTLTKGNFVVSDLRPNGVDEKTLLLTAAAAERFSGHPIALAVCAEAKARYGTIPEALEAEELPGMGVRAVVGEGTIFVGNARLMAMAGLSEEVHSSAGGSVHVARKGEYLGEIRIADEIKPSAAKAVDRLRAVGTKRIVMLSGDREPVAAAVAGRLGLDAYDAELLPGEKIERMEAIRNDPSFGGRVLYVGDGINDAPVLARADVGIAMGALGADAAIEAADVVIMNDDPEKIPLAIRIARATLRIVRQNIAFTLGVKLIVLLLGAFGYMNMWLAVFADVGVCILAILNALRTLKKYN